MRLFILLFFMYLPTLSFAQASNDSVELEIHVGDSIEIGVCAGEHYKHLDYFRKTRFTGTEKPYDTATGDGFYASFLASGDFDISELPKSFKGKTFVVLGLEVLSHKITGKPLYIMYLKGNDPNSIIWVDFYEAVENEEIKFIRYKFK